jgi:pimeloyl-ACP methyl ester carboxylesterase
VKLFTSTIGSGEPVILLHSGGMSSRQWRILAENLATTHRVISPDFLGCGENPPWPDEPFHFRQDVQAITELIEELNSPFHIVGHSYGGLIALTIARQMPSLLRTVSVYDPVAFGVLYDANDKEGLDNLEEASRSPVFQDISHGGDEAWLEGFIDYWNGPGTWKGLPDPTQKSFLRVGRKVFYEVLTLMSDRTTLDEFAAITCPALLMHGENSPAAARRVITLLGERLPRAKVVSIEGAGHMGPLLQMRLVNKHIVSVVRGQGTGNGERGTV